MYSLCARAKDINIYCDDCAYLTIVSLSRPSRNGWSRFRCFSRVASCRTDTPMRFNIDTWRSQVISAMATEAVPSTGSASSFFLGFERSNVRGY